MKRTDDYDRLRNDALRRAQELRRETMDAWWARLVAVLRGHSRTRASAA